MIGLIQRVSSAGVIVDDADVASIDTGLLLLLGIEKGDTEEQMLKLVQKIIKYRIFEDEQGRMNKSLLDVGGDLLVVSQFTLAANTSKGLRPGFEPAEVPKLANKMYKCFVEEAKKHVNNVQTGIFGADMKVTLVNDGPVTFWLQT
jgi:D-tyrosyl-tRNA(Tyr) deacylase